MDRNPSQNSFAYFGGMSACFLQHLTTITIFSIYQNLLSTYLLSKCTICQYYR